MASFRDRQGREWTVLVDGYVLHNTRMDGGINLGEVFAGAAKASLTKENVAVDPAILLALCWQGCKHNARVTSGKVDKEDFLRMLTGKVLTDAMEATVAALLECFAPPQEADKVDGPLAAEGLAASP